MSVSLRPTFATDGYQAEPTVADLNEIIAAVNESGGGGGAIVLSAPIAAAAASTDFTTEMVGTTPIAGAVTSISITVNADMFGGATNNRLIELKAYAMTGNSANWVKTIGGLEMVAGTGSTARGYFAIPVTDGAVLANYSFLLQSTKNGTGIAMVSGIINVTIEPI